MERGCNAMYILLMELYLLAVAIFGFFSVLRGAQSYTVWGLLLIFSCLILVAVVGAFSLLLRKVINSIGNE